jgi:hypothetical protein
MSAINVRDMKRMLNHLADEALVVVVSSWEEREVPVDPKWFFFDDRTKRLIIRGPLVPMDPELEQDLAAVGEVRAALRGWEVDDPAGQRERLVKISELFATR